jgi:hypothetical protein
MVTSTAQSGFTFWSPMYLCENFWFFRFAFFKASGPNFASTEKDPVSPAVPLMQKMHPCPHGGSWHENSSWIGFKIAVLFYFTTKNTKFSKILATTLRVLSVLRGFNVKLDHQVLPL